MKKFFIWTIAIFCCQISLSQVCNPPDIEIDGIPAKICVNDAPFTMTGMPEGGIFRIGETDILDGTIDPAVLGSGQFTVLYIYKFADDCPPITFSKQIIIDAIPLIIVNSDTVITCQSPAITLGTTSNSPNTQFIWTDFNGNTTQGPFLETTLPGNYTVEATQNGCQSSRQIAVMIDTIHPALNTVEIDVTDCNKPEFQLQAISDIPMVNLVWTNKKAFYSEAQNPITSDTGAFQVILTNPSNGCSTASIFLVKSPINNFDIALNAPSCLEIADGNIAIANIEGGVAPYLYSLNGNPFGIDSIFQDLSVGEYKLTVQDLAGCTVEKEITLEPRIKLEVELPKLNIIEFGNPISVSPIFETNNGEISSRLWEIDGNNVCDNCSTFETTAEDNFILTYRVFNEQGCTAADSIVITVDKTPKIFVPNVFSPNGDGQNDDFCIFTNPVINAISSFKVFDRWGNLLFEGENLPTDGTACWNGIVNNGLLQNSVLVYSLELDLATGNSVNYAGNVMVLK